MLILKTKHYDSTYYGINAPAPVGRRYYPGGCASCINASGSVFTCGQRSVNDVCLLRYITELWTCGFSAMWKAVSVLHDSKLHSRPLTDSDNKVRARSEVKWRWSFRSGLPDPTAKGSPSTLGTVVLLGKDPQLPSDFQKGVEKCQNTKNPCSRLTFSVCP